MTRKFNKVAVLMGGNSPEREISLRSGKNVLNSLLRQGYDAIGIDPSVQSIPTDIDAAYITLHGEGGEDGVIQGVLTHMGIPYTGPKILASAIAMDKIFTKRILLSSGIPTPLFEIITGSKTTLQFPFVLKPSNAGSSIGVFIIKNQKDFDEKYASISQQFDSIFVEEYVHGKEVTIGIVDLDNQLKVLPILQLIPHNEFYDFDAKYTKGKTDFILPAPLSKNTEAKVQDIAMATYRAIGCRSVSRIDMLIDKNDEITVLEVNTSPGMTDTSDLPAQAECAGISYDELVSTIMNSASL
ncbi:MAG: D-alanine--D-alanine ligase [Candidatus Margulisiibacteriota bacterium]|nr:MAG: hypothetical protein A2X43_07045 [Candidatus Margulisbacteria bacterium GWD2_39_127]OGI02964.1 MAG: hypothetical protein A2X42_12790 [Candidatus Margulisbacteria bacterium GWF2_38_17]OGI09443.1 MAG: hypothetical protein A2X41_12455 [Candidatus Margulisbacteria bacterium GWE2_39_32]PZM78757.1 MAG: D-alanine--D-alanine ligase [Candidatus Margulisiibacteriota bacterium]HAR63341.1 D-alanine--D-alanine ligase [Candidatus Margulisiibacteriota bacterium]